MMTTFKHAAAFVALGVIAIATTSVQGQAAGRAELKAPYAEGISEPSRRAKLAAQVPGVVKEVHVKVGDEVKQGQPLVEQDDRLSVNQRTLLEQEANSDIRIEAAKADLAQKQVELKRTEEMIKNNVATALELERAQLEAVFKGHQLNLSHLELAKAKLEAAGAKLKVEFMKILSPFDGFIEAVDTEVGEMLDPQRPGMMTVVKIDPLRIVVQLTAPQAAKLKKGDTLDVRYKNDPSDSWQHATVASLAPVANAGSSDQSKREVRLSLPNPQKREAGLWLWVKLPDATSTAGTAAAQ